MICPTIKRKLIPAALIALSVAGAAPNLHAQRVLDEIVVTAQKREENIREVPISITRMAGDRLTARFSGGEDILALAQAAPGLHVESSNGRLAPRFYLRGLGNADFTAAASQPVSLVFDDVPMEMVALKSFPLFDMDNIQVLRGPQGTLFGRNTTAGIVKVDTRRPTDDMEGYVQMSGGNMGTLNVEGAVGGSLIGDTLLGRVSFLRQNRDNWVDNGFTGEDNVLGGFEVLAGRAQLLWRPAENLDVLLMHQHQKQDGNSSTLFRANVLSTGSNKLNENFDRNTVFFDGGANNPAEIKSHGTTLTLNWTAGDYTVTSINSFQQVYDRSARGDIDGGFGCLFTCEGPAGPPSIPFSPFTSPFVVNVDTGNEQEIKQFSQELRVASNYAGPFDFQAGLFFFKDEINVISKNQSAGATTFQANSRAFIENTAISIFGQGSYNFTDNLKLSAGLRFTNDEKDAQVALVQDGVVQPFPEINLEDDNISWDVSLSYLTADGSQLYGRIAAGFRAGEIQDRVQDDPDVTTADAETITSFEIGYKAQWDKARLNAAVYYYVVDDLQLSAIGGADNSTRLLNADEGIGYGVELELDYALTNNLVISGGFAWTKTEFNDSGLRTAVCGSGLCTVTDPIDDDGFALLDGNPFQHAPKWTANVELDYTLPLASGNELYLFTDWRLRGETNHFLYRSLEYVSDTQFEGGLRLGFRNPVRGFEVGLFGRNITDEENVIGGIDFANLTAYTNQPRVWGAEASFRF